MVQRSQNKTEMMKDLGKMMTSFCDDEATEEGCVKLARSHDKRSTFNDVLYPEDFDSNLLTLIDDVYTTLSSLQDDNVEAMLQRINIIKEKMKRLDVNPVHKHANVACALVALESTKL